MKPGERVGSGKHFPLVDKDGGKTNKVKGVSGSVKGDVAAVGPPTTTTSSPPPSPQPGATGAARERIGASGELARAYQNRRWTSRVCYVFREGRENGNTDGEQRDSDSYDGVGVCQNVRTGCRSCYGYAMELRGQKQWNTDGDAGRNGAESVRVSVFCCMLLG